VSRRRALAIVERAHRGAAEQQYAHVLWLVRSLHGQFDMSAWLRGAAVLYALPRERPATLAIGGAAVCLPDYEAMAADLIAAGVTVHVSAPSLRQLGVAERDLVGGVHPAEDTALARLCQEHEFVWFL
jgi:hypothetical protein